MSGLHLTLVRLSTLATLLTALIFMPAVGAQVQIVVNTDGSPAGPHPAPANEPADLAWQPADHPSITPVPVVTRTPDGKTSFSADDRLDATVPSSPVPLAQPLEIPLHFTEGEVVSVSVTQSNGTGKLSNQPANQPSGESDSKVISEGARITSDEGATKTIQVLPLQLGAVNLQITATFKDGGYAQHVYALNVVPSSKGLKKVSLIHGVSNLALIYEGAPKDAQGSFSPELVYQQLRDPVKLADTKSMTLQVAQSNDYPVVRVDPDGSVHALRFGETTITGDFAGVKDRIGVTVYTKQTAPPAPGAAQKRARKLKPQQ